MVTLGQEGVVALQLQPISSILVGIEVEGTQENVPPPDADLSTGNHSEDVDAVNMREMRKRVRTSSRS